MEIKSFSDIDNALKKVCELSVGIEKINGEVTLECNRIKESRKAEVERLESEKNYIEQQITFFVRKTSTNLPKNARKNLPSARSATA